LHLSADDRTIVNHDPVPSGPALDDEQFRRLAEYCRVEDVSAGQDLYASGDHSYDLFLLGTAAVDIVRGRTLIEPERVSTGVAPVTSSASSTC
jgi:thioredoxin reductase (NADPH)